MSVRNLKLIFLLTKENICLGCSEVPTQRDGSFRRPKQLLKLIDLSVSPILCTLICVIFKTEVHKYVLHMPF